MIHKICGKFPFKNVAIVYIAFIFTYFSFQQFLLFLPTDVLCSIFCLKLQYCAHAKFSYKIYEVIVLLEYIDLCNLFGSKNIHLGEAT